MQRAPILVLKEGTDSSQGKPQLISNINACQAIVDAVRTTLGPRGMDKLIVDNKGNCDNCSNVSKWTKRHHYFDPVQRQLDCQKLRCASMVWLVGESENIHKQYLLTEQTRLTQEVPRLALTDCLPVLLECQCFLSQVKLRYQTTERQS